MFDAIRIDTPQRPPAGEHEQIAELTRCIVAARYRRGGAGKRRVNKEQIVRTRLIPKTIKERAGFARGKIEESDHPDLRRRGLDRGPPQGRRQLGGERRATIRRSGAAQRQSVAARANDRANGLEDGGRKGHGLEVVQAAEGADAGWGARIRT